MNDSQQDLPADAASPPSGPGSTPHPLDAPFGTVSDLVAHHARTAPARLALVDGDDPAIALDYAALDRRMDRIAGRLRAAGVRSGESIAILAAPSVAYAAVFLGALRAGIAVAPLAPGTAADALARMLADSGARLLFTDRVTAQTLPVELAAAAALPRVLLEDWPSGEGPSAGGSSAGGSSAAGPSAAESREAPFQPPTITPDHPFNIIYSSGTTGTPKGIVQPHRMRWAHMQRGRPYGYGPTSVTVLATPLYSNTTLVSFFPSIGLGGTVVLMTRFGVDSYLRACERFRATHTMLVPVQYQRLMASDAFERYDLSAFVAKFCTSAPFPAALKADILARWPGGLIEFYGMTEGGGTCILEAHRHPDKLHTVGRPAAGSTLRLIDEAGAVLDQAGAAGEVVGRSGGMMTGYHGQPGLTREAEWFDADGVRHIRTGDIGRFDADGFLTLIDRRKDMIISGGFNLYPSDLEAVLASHPAVAEAAVVGVPSERWGESPAGFVALRSGVDPAATTGESLRAWANERLGKTQRLVAVTVIDELPRSAIGKVLKRALRDACSTRAEGERRDAPTGS